MIKQHIFYNTGIEHLLNVFRHISENCLIMTGNQQAFLLLLCVIVTW